MNQSLFDINTKYLLHPPPFLYPTFQDFKNFYCIYRNKTDVVGQLLKYCRSLRKQGIKPFALILGGEFIKFEDEKKPMKIVLCLQTTERIPPATAAIQFSERVYNIYDHLVLPIGQAIIANSSTQILSVEPIIHTLSKDHKLSTITKPVGLICLNFDEVVI